MIARKYGKVKKRGIPDKVSAGKLILRDWNSGKIPYFTPPPEEEVVDTEKGQAIIVSSFGKEFNIFDDEVIETLDEKSEYDFIRLQDGARSQTDALIEKKEDEEMEESESNEGGSDMVDGEKVEKVATLQNEKMAEAEDFDFRSM